MEEFLESELSCDEFVSDLKLAKEMVGGAVLGILRVVGKGKGVELVKALEKWKIQVFDDLGAGVWMRILRDVVNRMLGRVRRLQSERVLKGFCSWRGFVRESREKERLRSLNEGLEFEYQREIKELEIRINELQIRNEELNKVHGHFLNRETIYRSKIAELACTQNEHKITPNIQDHITALEDLNYDLLSKVQTAEHLLKQFLTCTKPLISY